MRRWNGWGDEHTVYPLPATGRKLLESYLGKLQPQPDADLPDLVKGVPPSRLPEHPLISQDASERVLHARGQSLPDWVARRSGQIGAYPDGVAYPASASEVRQLLDFTRREQFHLIPYGGGTSVLGHINPFAGDTPVLTLDMSRMHLLLDLDKTSQLAVFEAGVQGPQIEAQLNPLGFTLGHFPQSFECSSLGGWIATRSSGQQSYYYGRIEQLFAGGLLETPAGMQELPEFPASAAGPDLRQLVLGCEGRLGVITQATVRVRHLPDIEAFYGVFFPDWESGAQAVRQIAQEHIPVSMLRLSDPLETAMTLSLSGKEQLVRLAERGLRLLGVGDEPCLLVYGVTGSQSTTRSARHQADGILRRFSGLNTGQFIGKQWCKSRFLFPYLRNTLWDIGIALDTLETALPWRGVIQAATEIKGAIQQAQAAAGKQVWVFAHLSHVYRDGASIYVTYVFPQEVDPNATLERWQAMKTAASLAIVRNHGTISHQHGVGLDHKPYLIAEIGKLGLQTLSAAAQVYDPAGMMNPGKCF
jgi:alkyldihydroxyacetonephosphate synthase